MVDTDKIQEIIFEYSKLKHLEGYSEQTRGQRFNSLILETLQCYGINAITNVRNKGEIDVAFELDGKRFIIEAKWEKDKIDTSAIAKLQKRLRQRLSGTIGIFISISGYTKEAIDDISDGEQLSVILLNKDHFEAMLSGFIPPNELINILISKASWFGNAYISITNLFPTINPEELKIQVNAPIEYQSKDIITFSKENLKVKIVLSNLPFGQSGIAMCNPDKFLITQSSGIYSFNISAEKLLNVCSIPDCSRNPVVKSDMFFIVRKTGVACIANGTIKFVAGGFSGNTCLFKDNNDNIWAFSNGFEYIKPQLALLGIELGDEIRYNIDFPGSSGINAARVSHDKFLIVGNKSAIYTLNQDISYINLDLVNPMGLGQIDNNHFFIVSDSNKVQLSLVNTDNNSLDIIAKFNLIGSISEISMCTEKSGYLFSHYTTNKNETKGIILYWEIDK